MKCWPKAGKTERKLFFIISLVFKNHPHLLEFLFDCAKPRLRDFSEELISQCEGKSANEDVLVRVALDIWNGSNSVSVGEMIETLSERNYLNVLEALLNLAPKHPEGWNGPVYRQLKWASLSIEEDTNSSI